MERSSRTQSPEAVILQSLMTCPACGFQRVEEMPEYSCVIAYQCPGCGETLRPADGDCCVFCTYGSAPCPPLQVRSVASTRG